MAKRSLVPHILLYQILLGIFCDRLWRGLRPIAFSGSEASSRSGSIRVAWPKGQGASHFLSLFPIPYSLFPIPYSLLPAP
ncbi:hypothetical protein [Moorena sp. SIO4G3]|uniref:hypothetical protein n=1 Tax=Moorena sp. SIO4G3 TaxID=2607821 RepID=UPI00142C6DFE|nr:hypothetical protein [Moorena sp. SIO4G3]NEO78660.1 hypothetical protein [Moorena sp. SIO4G3]